MLIILRPKISLTDISDWCHLLFPIDINLPKKYLMPKNTAYFLAPIGALCALMHQDMLTDWTWNLNFLLVNATNNKQMQQIMQKKCQDLKNAAKKQRQQRSDTIFKFWNPRPQTSLFVLKKSTWQRHDGLMWWTLERHSELNELMLSVDDLGIRVYWRKCSYQTLNWVQILTKHAQKLKFQKCTFMKMISRVNILSLWYQNQFSIFVTFWF